jgi:hypothetical protein
VSGKPKDAGIEPWVCKEEHRFDVAKAAFEQNFEQFRHLNEQMNRIPPFAVTLTAGLWYVAVVVNNYGDGLSPLMEQLARFALMVFAGISNFALVWIAIRVRDVMSGYLQSIKRFEGEWWVERGRPSFFWLEEYSMVSMYSILMVAAAVLSWIGAFVLFWPWAELPICWGIAFVTGSLFVTILLSYWMPRWLTR